jgi:predicted small metal-binding protein
MKRKMLRCNKVPTGSNNDCTYEINGDTEEELYSKMIDHAQKEHDLRHEELTPKLKEQIRDLISLDD